MLGKFNIRDFTNVKTDGEYWLNAQTNEKIKIFNRYKRVFDFRLAILYELARMRHQIVTVNI